METAVPSYLSLEHKQALASNVIPVNMRESDERGSGFAGSLAPFPHFRWVFVWITGIQLDVMDQHSLSRGIVRSYTWGETQLLLFLPVHYIPLLLWWTASGEKAVTKRCCERKKKKICVLKLFVCACATARCKTEFAFIWTSLMKLGADLLSEWRFKCGTRIQWASSYLWKTLALPRVARSIAEIMMLRRCRGCADISICFISISDKAFRLFGISAQECFILRRSLSSFQF